MKKVKALLLKVVTSAVFMIGITTVTSTSRYYGYQPELDGEVMKKYL